MVSRIGRISIYLILVTASIAYATENTENFAKEFKEAADMLKPYLILPNHVAKDARTDEGRSQVTKAIAMLERVTERNPDHWQSYWFIGKGYQALRKHNAAYEAFKQSLIGKSENANVQREFMIEAICVNKTAEAVNAAREVAMAHQQDADLLANLGLA